MNEIYLSVQMLHMTSQYFMIQVLETAHTPLTVVVILFQFMAHIQNVPCVIKIQRADVTLKMSADISGISL